MANCISFIHIEINTDNGRRYFGNISSQFAIRPLFNYENLLHNRREKLFGRALYKMATLFWKTNILIMLISCLCATDGANILGIFPMPARSHMIIHSALMKELARRGHQVTVFSPFPEKHPIQNFTDIEFKLSYSELLPKSGEYNSQLQVTLYIYHSVA
jgi:hypothetical protein